jgi:hypothetical protein
VHHDTAPARSWVQLRVPVVACTAVDDPPPQQDDGPARGVVRAFGRRCDDGLQTTPLVLWRHRSSRRRLRRPNYPLRCAQGGQVFRRAASTPRRSTEPWRRRRQTLFAGQSPLALVLTFSALVEQLGRPDGSTPCSHPPHRAPNPFQCKYHANMQGTLTVR